MIEETEFEEVEYEEDPDIHNEDVGFFDDDFGEAEVPNRYAMPEVEELLEEVIETLAAARPLPMSATVKINRDEILHLLEQVQDRLPEELRAARWLLKERDDFVAKARQEHADLIEEGRSQVARMIEREQVVKAAEIRARQVIADARHEANTMKRQTEEFCDKRLASIETIMKRTMGTLQKGRERLNSTSNFADEKDFMPVTAQSDIDLVDDSYYSDKVF